MFSLSRYWNGNQRFKMKQKFGQMKKNYWTKCPPSPDIRQNQIIEINFSISSRLDKKGSVKLIGKTLAFRSRGLLFISWEKRKNLSSHFSVAISWLPFYSDGLFYQSHYLVISPLVIIWVFNGKKPFASSSDFTPALWFLPTSTPAGQRYKPEESYNNNNNNGFFIQ